MQRRQWLSIALLSLAYRPASATAAWQQDVRGFVDALASHVAPFEFVEREQLLALAAAAEKEATRGDPGRWAVAFQRLVGAVGDIHTTVQLPELHAARLPIQLMRYAEGWFVTAATSAMRHWLSRRILAVGGTSPDSYRSQVRTLAAYPLDAEYDAFFDSTLQPSAAVLASIGASDGAVIDLVAAKGLNKALVGGIVPLGDAVPDVTAADAGHRPMLPSERTPGRFYLVDERASDRAVVVVYRRCAADPVQSLAEFANEVRQATRRVGARRAVIDLRGNGGGDSSLLSPIIGALRETSALRAAGALRVLTNARTQSSALLNAYSLRQDFGALVIGETAGTALNHLGEVRQQRLPSGRRLTLSSRRFTLAPADPRGRRAGLDPDVPIQLSWIALQSGVDNVLEAALALP